MRVRQRYRDADEAEQQHKQTVGDRKLQQAIERAEKAHEDEQKKNARVEARAAANEEKLRTKLKNETERSDPIATQRVMALDSSKLYPEYVLERPWRMAAKSLRADGLSSVVGKDQCQDISHY